MHILQRFALCMSSVGDTMHPHAMFISKLKNSAAAPRYLLALLLEARGWCLQSWHEMATAHPLKSWCTKSALTAASADNKK